MPDFTHGVAFQHLSSRARRVLEIDADTACSSLVPRQPGAIEAKDLLETLKPDDVIAAPVRDTNSAACALSGLWLWHDYLDASHAISQAVETPAGSFWHAIMHRREGDFSNAKYWYRQCGNHPLFPSLAQQVNVLTDGYLTDKSLLRLTVRGWDANAFVDLVETVHWTPDDPRYAAAVAIQKLEWRTVFAATLRDVVGME